MTLDLKNNKNSNIPLNTTHTPPKVKLYSLQVIRAIASILVVLVHGQLIFQQNLDRDFLFDIFAFGGSGVDIFFVLSGFIIFYIHKKDIGNPSIIKDFLLKRIIRIYPIYWIILSGKILASVDVSNLAIANYNFLETIKAFLLFPQDRILLSEQFLGVSWTLSYEIFFYICFGLMIYFKPQYFLSVASVWLLGVFLNFVNLINIPSGNVLLEFFFDERHLEFILGCFAAHIIANNIVYWKKSLVWSGLFLYTLGAINIKYELIEISRVISIAIPITMIIIGGVAWEINRGWKISSWLLLLGNASYSIYLFHGFIMNNLTKITEATGAINLVTSNDFLFSLFAILNALIAIAAGCVLYILIEKPLITFLRHKIVK